MDRFSTIYHLRLREDASFACPVAEGMELRIGRDPANALQLAHRSIAPFHCRVRNERGALKLEPFGQLAVYVDSRRIRGPLMLSGRERVRVGEIELYFEKELRELCPQRPVAARLAARPLRWARSVLWLAVSVAVHALALMFLGALPFGWSRPQAADDVILTTFSLAARNQTPVLRKLEPAAPPQEPLAESRALVDLPGEVSEPPELWQAPEAAPADGTADPGELAMGRLAGERGGVIGVGAGGFGSGGRGRNLAGRPRAGRDAAHAAGLRRFLEAVRSQGMDLVFVIDTTISMESILDRVTATADRMVHLLGELVHDLRVGVVAYRDEQDAYVTISSPLDANLYRTLCFLHDLAATGGGDFEEAVERGLSVACKLEWRPQARRVIMLIADAPPHQKDASEVLRQVSAFASPPLPNHGEALVAAMFAVSLDRTTQENRGKIADFFRAVARAGHGDFLELEEHDPIGQELLVLALGERFRQDLAPAAADVDHIDVKARVIARHVALSDRAWFLRALGRAPVPSEIVEALVALRDRATLERILDVVTDERRNLDSRYAALYVLKRACKARLSFDPGRPLAEQGPAADALRAAVRLAP
ncbi:MAG: VWA domain-containing protein [Planctomycetota bacterium]